jgi:putative addiction module killer protein
MSQWHIEYWVAGTGKSPIEKWLDKLDKDQFKSVAKEISMLEEVGNELKLPHSRALGKGLFELRERRYGLRIYYCFKGEYIIILLAAGDKKSQEKDIKVTRKRIEEI